MAKVPLLLQMLVITYEELDRIPLNLGELLRNYIDEVLNKRKPGKMAGRFKPEIKKDLLAAVAWRMREQGLSASAPKALAWTAFADRLSKYIAVKDGKAEEQRRLGGTASLNEPIKVKKPRYNGRLSALSAPAGVGQPRAYQAMAIHIRPSHRRTDFLYSMYSSPNSSSS